MSIISDALKKAENARRIALGEIPTKQEPGGEERAHKDALNKNGPRPQERFGLAVFFVLVLAFVSGWYLLSRKSAKTEPAGTTAKPVIETPVKAESVLDVPYEGVIYKSENTGPLLKPDLPTPATPPLLTLNGIMYSAQMRYAVINNGMFQEGDLVNGAKVIRIEKDTVIFNYEGSDFTLTLKK